MGREILQRRGEIRSRGKNQNTGTGTENDSNANAPRELSGQIGDTKRRLGGAMI